MTALRRLPALAALALLVPGAALWACPAHLDPEAKLPDPSAAAPDTLPDRLARTLVGTIGDRAVAVELRLEDGRASGWIEEAGPPGDAIHGGGTWLSGDVAPDGTARLEVHDDERSGWIEGRLTMAGGRLTLEGERRPLDGGAPEPVRLVSRGLDLGGGATLVSRDVHVADPARAFVFYAEAARVVGPDGGPPEAADLRRLDAALAERVESERRGFVESFATVERDTTMDRLVRETGPSWYEAAYDAWIAADSILSVEGTVWTYGTGAAHPNSSTWTRVWDLGRGEGIELADLFRAGSAWLDTLSSRAVSILVREALETSDEEWIREGAGPSMENFDAWSVVPSGVRIVFDPYQIAPYAAGPRAIVVPWASLESVLDPDGPVAGAAGGRVPSGAARGSAASSANRAAADRENRDPPPKRGG